jgi:2-iminoacetate synthase
MLVQYILAFRICLPDVPLVLSTRESAAFRDGMAGIGISRMSVASRTTVGGYGGDADDNGQFDVQDVRGVDEFCAALRKRGLEPVFKNWDATYR